MSPLGFDHVNMLGRYAFRMMTAESNSLLRCYPTPVLDANGCANVATAISQQRRRLATDKTLAFTTEQRRVRKPRIVSEQAEALSP